MIFPNASLDDICSLITDGTHYTPPDIGEGIPFLTVRDMTPDGLDFEGCAKISSEEFEKLDAGNCSPRIGDILFSKDGTVGKVHLVKEQAKFGVLSSIAILRPQFGEVDGLYLSWALRSPDLISQAGESKTGSALRRLVLKDLKKLSVKLPPLATQQHIARVLEQADQLRKQAQQMESELKQLAQSLFQEMFGDLFRNPKAWPIVELSGLITQGPKNGLYKHADDYGAGSPIVRIDNFYDGELTDHSTFKRVAATAAELDKFKIDENSILINRVNSPEYLGKAALVERLQEPTVFESNMMNFSVNTDRVNPFFLVTQLGSLYVKEQIRKASKDAVNQSSINQDDVQSFTVALPSIDYQNEFAKRLSEIRLVRSMCLEGRAVVDEAFNSLMQRAFNGELTAPERKAA